MAPPAEVVVVAGTRPEFVKLAPDELAARLADLLSAPDARDAMTGASGLYGHGTAAERIVAVLEEFLADDARRR